LDGLKTVSKNITINLDIEFIYLFRGMRFYQYFPAIGNGQSVGSWWRMAIYRARFDFL